VVPGVKAVTAMAGLPPTRPINASDTLFEGFTPYPGGPDQNVDYYQNAMTDYFETMGIPIVQGRGLERTDIHAPALVAVVNETLANRFWIVSGLILAAGVSGTGACLATQVIVTPVPPADLPSSAIQVRSRPAPTPRGRGRYTALGYRRVLNGVT